MRKIPVSYLQPGMKLARSVFTSENILLIRSGMLLSKNVINRLKLIDIPSVYVDDGFISDIDIEDVLSDKTRSDAISKVRDIFQNTKVNNKCGKATIFLNESKVFEVVETILEGILFKKDVLVSLTDIRSFDDYTYGHSVNVCTLALLTGRVLKLSDKSLVKLGAGAILHDLGKVLIPRSIINKPGPLTQEEFDLVQKHSEDGYLLLKQQSKIDNLSATVLYEHHERINGSGYPRGLMENEIHLYSKIVSLVDVYDALTVDRVYRKAYMPHEAYEMLAGSGGGLFDFEIVKAFLGNIAIYPIGTFLELSTGQVGVVVEVTKGLTHRPTVRIFFEEIDRVVNKPYEIDLSEHRNIVVNRVLEHLEVNKLLPKAKKI